MPDFDSEVLEYRVDVEEPDTRALCYGEPVIVDGASIALRAPTGNRLEEGDNDYYLDVTALDGESTKTYRVIVYRAPVPARDPRLTKLEVYLGNQLLPLTPAFNRHVFEYTATLPAGATQGLGDLVVEGQEGITFSYVGPGIQSAVNDAILGVGTGRFVLRVFASDASITQDYTVTVVQAQDEAADDG